MEISYPRDEDAVECVHAILNIPYHHRELFSLLLLLSAQHRSTRWIDRMLQGSCCSCEEMVIVSLCVYVYVV